MDSKGAKLSAIACSSLTWPQHHKANSKSHYLEGNNEMWPIGTRLAGAGITYWYAGAQVLGPYLVPVMLAEVLVVEMPLSSASASHQHGHHIGQIMTPQQCMAVAVAVDR
jgi:hypothetical protein